MTEGASEPYKQCILQLCKQDSLGFHWEFYSLQIFTLLYIPLYITLLPLSAAAASSPSMFLWIWATQLCVYQICCTRRFLSVRAVLGPLAGPWGCLLSRWGKEPRAGWENPAKTRLRDSTARSRSVQVNCDLCNPSLLVFLTENTLFPALWIHYGKYRRFSLFLWLQQSKFRCHHRLFLACAMGTAAFPSTALILISPFPSSCPAVALFICSCRFLGDFLGSILLPSKPAHTPFQSWVFDPDAENLTPPQVCAASVPGAEGPQLWVTRGTRR